MHDAFRCGNAQQQGSGCVSPLNVSNGGLSIAVCIGNCDAVTIAEHTGGSALGEAKRYGHTGYRAVLLISDLDSDSFVVNAAQPGIPTKCCLPAVCAIPGRNYHLRRLGSAAPKYGPKTRTAESSDEREREKILMRLRIAACGVKGFG